MVVALISSFGMVNAADYFWVGGAGNWSDHSNHWATTSGGSVFHNQVPSPLDDVIFDANSFPAGGTLTCDVNAFCASMDWQAGITTSPTLSIGSRTLTNGGGLTVNSAITWSQSTDLTIPGDFVLNSTTGNINFDIKDLYLEGSFDVNTNSILTNIDAFYFSGNTSGHTITTNGLIIQDRINFVGTGEWTLTDDLTSTSGVYLNTATFRTGGNDMFLGYEFNALGGSTWTLDLTGSSTIKALRRWRLHTSTNATFIGGTATIELEDDASDDFYFDGGARTYYKVHLKHNRVHSGNTLYIRDNNTYLNDFIVDLESYQYVSFRGSQTYKDVTVNYNTTTYTNSPNTRFTTNGNSVEDFTLNVANNIQPDFYIDGTSNTFSSIDVDSRNNYINGTNSLGDVDLNDSRYISFAYNQTNTITSLTANGDCENYLQVTSNYTSLPAILNMATGTVNLDFVILTSITAQGVATFNATNAFDEGNNTGWNLTLKPAETFYWIGGTGNWNEATHWATTSGGTASICLPTKYDNIVFDANSFTASGGTVSANDATHLINNITFTSGVLGNPTFTTNKQLHVYGDYINEATMTYTGTSNMILYKSMKLNANLVWNQTGRNYFRGVTAGLTIDMAGHKFKNHVDFDVTAGTGEYTMLSDFMINSPTSHRTYMRNANFKSNGNEIDFGYQFQSDPTENGHILDFTGTSLIKVGYNWNIDANTSQLATFTIGTAKVQMSTSNNNMYFYGGHRTYANVEMNETHPSSSRTLHVYNDNIINGTFDVNMAGLQRFYVGNNVQFNGLFTLNATSTNQGYQPYMEVYYADFADMDINSNTNFRTFFRNNVTAGDIDISTSTNWNNRPIFDFEGNGTYGNVVFPDGAEVDLYGGNTWNFGGMTLGGSCDQPAVLNSHSAGSQATLNMTSGATFNMNYVYVQDIIGTGGNAFNFTNSLDLGNNTNLTMGTYTASTYYWIGGAGDWSDPNHWSLTSGGLAQVCIPVLVDDVIFDANSFTATGGTVTLDQNSEFNNMTWTSGVLGTPRLTGNYQLRAHGDVVVDATMEWNHNRHLYLEGSFSLNSNVNWTRAYNIYFNSDLTTNTIDLDGATLKDNIYFDRLTSTGTPGWKMLSDFHNTVDYNCDFRRGTLDLDGNDATFGYIFNARYSNIIDLKFANSNVKVRRQWYISTSTNTTADFSGMDLTIETIHNEDFNFYGGSRTYGDVTMNHNYNGGWRNNYIYDANTISSLEFNSPGTNSYKRLYAIHATKFGAINMNSAGPGSELHLRDNVEVGTLNHVNTRLATVNYINLYNVEIASFNAGENTRVRLENNKTADIENFNLATHCTRMSTIEGASATSIFDIENGPVNIDYISLINHTVQGNSTYNANNAIVSGTVNGWNLSGRPDYNLYWVGPDNGTFNDVNNWSLTSGGAANACVFPGQNDNAIFDNNSFTADGQRVNINATAHCKNFIWKAFNFRGRTTDNDQLHVHGDLSVVAPMDWQHSGTLYLDGSLDFNTGMTLPSTTRFYFDAITTGHTIDFAGLTINNHLYFRGNGGEWTLESPIAVNRVYYTIFERGTLITNGYDVDFGNRFYSPYGNNVRHLNIEGSYIRTEWEWQYNGNGATISSLNSTIELEADGGTNRDIDFYGGGNVYYDVIMDHLDNANYEIAILDGGNTFHDVKLIPFQQKQIRLEGANTYNRMDIEVNNNNVSTISILNVNGSNTFGTFTLLSPGTAGPYAYFNQDNTFANFVSAGRGTRIYLGALKTQSVDDFTLLGTGGQPAFLYSTITGTQANLYKADGEVCFDFTWVQDIKATGLATWNAGASSTNLGNNTNWNFASCSGYYWVGNSGDWNDVNHWATSSGGTVKHIIAPSKFDNVYFDANSFSAAGAIVDLNITTPECRDMNWVSAFYTPTLVGSGATSVDIHGALKLTSGMNMNYAGDWKFKGVSTNFIVDAASHTLENVSFEGPGTTAPNANWVLYNDLNVGNDIDLSKGGFYTQGYSVNTTNFNVVTNQTKTLNLSNSTVEIQGGTWNMDDASGLTFDAGNSHIYLYSDGGTVGMNGGGLDYNDVTFSTSNTHVGTLTDDNSFATFKLEPGVTLIVEESSTQTADQFVIDGVCTQDITVKSTSSGTAATFSQATGTVDANFVNIEDNTATGGATFTANLSVDNGNVSGWAFSNNSLIDVSIAFTDATCPLPNDGIATANITGGKTPFIYDWSTFEDTKDIVGLVPGVYTVEVTDSNGCVDQASVTIGQPATYGFGITAAGSEICNGETDGTLTSTTTNTNTPISYEWDNSVSTANQTNIAPGNYAITVTDADGCEAIENVAVVEKPSMDPSIIATDVTVCFGESIDFTGKGGGAGTCLDFDGQNDYVNVTGINIPAGAVTVEYWSHVASNELETDRSFDVGGFTAHAPYSDGTFYLDGGGTRITFPYTPYLDEWVHIACVTGGTGSSFKAIYVNGVLAASTTGASNISAATTATFGQGGNRYHNAKMDEFRIWGDVRTQAEIQANMNTVLSGSETDLVAYFDMNEGTGNTTISGAVAGVVGTLTNMDASTDFENSTIASFTDPSLGYTWDFDDTNTGTGTSVSHTYAAAGTYTVEVTADDGAGCTETATLDVTVLDEITATATVTDVSCNGGADGSVAFNISGGQAPYTVTSEAEFSDEFGGTVLTPGRYTTDNGTATYSIANNELSIASNGNGWNKFIYTNQTFKREVGKSFTFDFYHNANTHCMIGWYGNSTGSNTFYDLIYGMYFNNNSHYGVYEDGGHRAWLQGSIPGGYTNNTWYECKIVLKTAGADYFLRKRGQTTYTLMYSSTHSTEDDLRLGVNLYGAGPSLTDNWVVGGSSSTTGLTADDYTYSIKDGQGCTLDVDFTVDEPAIIAGTINLPSSFCIGSGAVNLSSTLTGGTAPYTYSWDLDGSTSTSATPSINYTSVATKNITLDITDAKGCTFQLTGSILVEVCNSAPVAVCQNITVSADANCEAAPLAADFDGGSTDPEGDPLTFTMTPSGPFGIGIHPVTITVADPLNAQDQCTATITVEDNTAPTAICQNITVQLDANGQATITAADIDNGSSDNCASVILSINNSTFDCNDIGGNPVILTVSDGVLATTCTATVTVEDNIDPVANTASLATITGECSVTISGAPTATDNCAGTITGTTSDPLSYTAQGTYTITWKYTDDYNNSTTQTQTVVVDDVTAPVADVTTLATATGDCSASVTAPIATDACEGSITGTTTNPTSYTAQGTYTVTWTYADGNGNSSQQTQTVVVDDNTAPTAICQDVTVQLDASGNGTLTAAQLDNGSNDACGPVTLSASKTSFDCLDVNAQISCSTGALDFDGSNDYLRLSNSANLTPTGNEVTVEGWVYVNAITGTTQQFFHKWQWHAVGASGYTLEIFQQKLAFVVGNGPGVNYEFVQSATGTLPVQQWVHIAGVCTGTELIIYIDGVETARKTLANSPVYTNATIPIIGARSSDGSTPTPNEHLGGRVDDIAIWNVAKTQAEIQAELDQCVNTSSTDLLALWDMEDGSGTTASDAIGSHDATLTNMDANTDWIAGATNLTQSGQYVTLTVDDANGNSSTCDATITVEDNVDPTAICQDVTVQLDANGVASITAAQIDNGSNDACGIASISVSQTDFDCTDVGLVGVDVTLTVTDNNGNTSTCDATVTIQDNIAPTALCQSITVALDANGQASITAADIDNGSNDACGVTLSASQTAFDCTHTGPNNVTLTVTDDNGNVSTCVAVVTIEDNIDPTAVCNNLTIDLQNRNVYALTQADIDFMANGSDDNCDFTYAITSGQTSFDCDDKAQSFTVTLTVTDASGNTATCNPVISITDDGSVCNDPPTAICQNITVSTGANCDATITAAQIDNNSTDPDGDVLTYTLSNYGPFAVGTHTVTLTVADAEYTDACTATVTVEDNTNPVALCQAVTVQLDANGVGSITANDIDNGSNDACGIATVVASKTSFDCTNVGPNTVTLTVTDNNGNVSTCTTTVTVEDKILPTMFVPGDLIRSTDLGQCQAYVAVQVPINLDDNCGIASLVNTYNNTGNASDTYPEGLTVFDWVLTDVNGNIYTYPQAILIIDNEDPVVTCTPNISVNNDAGQCDATINVPAPTATDNCGILSIRDFNTLLTHANGTYPVGTTTITWMIEDIHNNIVFCTTDVTVTDNEAPSITCAAAITQNTDLDVCESVVTVTSPTAGDNCSVVSVVNDYNNTANASDTYPLGMTTITWTVTDIYGNQSTCQQTVTVEDHQVPYAICKPATVQLDAFGNGSITAADINDGSNDACGIASVLASQTTFDCSHVGSIPVTLTVTDNNGNVATCNTTVTVEDNVDPIALCKPVTVQLDASGSGSITAADINNGSNDACGIASAVASKTMFDCTNVGTNTVTLTVTDNNGNVSTCTTTVTVEDNVDPVALCKTHTVQLDANGNGSITAADINNGSNDACGIASVVASKTSYDCTNVGPNTVTLTVTDNNGNVSTCTTTVTVEDNVDPAALCKTHTVQLDANGNGSITAADINDGSNDACGIASVVAGQTAFDCNHVGPNTVTLTVTDNNGNVSTCATTVTVEDNVNPVALCQAVTIQLDANGEGSITTADVDNGSNDACGIASLSLDDYDFTCTDVGANTVTLTVTDNNNVSTCQAVITVEDNVNPVAICQAVTVQLDANGNGSITTSDVDNGSNDACGIQSLSLSKTDFTCTDVGTNTVTLTVTDNNNNVSTCTATITVEDNIDPIALCKTHTVQLDANGDGSMTATDIDNGSNDACGIASTVAGKTSFDCSNVGANTVTLTVTDNNGNVSTCTTTVTVEDNVDPVAICRAVTVQLDANGEASITTADIDNGSNDACGIASLALSKYDYDCSNLGGNTVTLTVTDNNGNTSTCTATVTVEDNIDPIISGTPANINVIADRNDCDPQVSWTEPTASDNCYVTITSTHQPGDEFSVGTTTVTYTAVDQSNNTVTSSFTITVQPEPFVITSLTSATFNGGWNISCNGLEDGSATVILEGGCYPYTYLWSDGQTSATATNLAAGTYTVTISDGNGTSTNGSITLTEPNELVITSLTNTNICANDLAAVSSAGYEYKMTIDIDPQMVNGSTDLTNFPVVLELQDNSFKCVQFGGNLYSENGDDLMITNSSCDPLPYQVERYDPATGDITIWVQVDELSASATTSLNIIYSNEYEAQNNDGTNVWDADYAAAWHMSDELHAGKLEFEDATANTNDVEKRGSTSSSQFINNIAGAFDFGSGHYSGEIDRYDLDNSLRVDDEVFVQAWVKVEDAKRCNKQVVISKGKNSDWKYASYYLGVDRDPKGRGQYGIELQGTISTSNGSHRFEAGSINEDEWTLLGLSYNGSTIKAYINGQEVYSHAWSGTITDYYKDDLYMGRKLDGGLDEARVSSVARADNWIGTEYNNQLDPSANITLGSETENGCGNICVGTAQVAVEGGTPAYIYNWSNGDNTTDASGLCEGEHTITVTDQNGCLVSDDVDVEINRDEFVELSYDTENVNCYGESNGSIDLTIAGRQPNPDGKLNRDIWHNINGKYISNLTNSSRYPNTPDISTIVTTFEGPSNYGDQYGQRIYGWVKAPETGSYRFMVSGDESVELWVSPTENPQDKQRVAYSNRSTHHRHCHQYSSQRSAMIPLIAGNYYYVEVLHKEYRGSDHVTVGWELPSGTTELPIGSTNITTTIPQITVPAVQSITWSNGGETEDLDSLPAGIYNVYVVTQSGCVATDAIEITQPDPLVVVGDASHISCNGETDGSIDASATGGTAPYTYAWIVDGQELTENEEAHACVAKSSDDAEEKLRNGDVYTYGKTLDLGSTDSRCRPSDAQEVGLRFQNLDIPQGAAITGAYLKFYAYGTSMASTSLDIKGQLSDDAQTFTYHNDYDISSRTNTNASVAWNNVSTWSNGQWYQSPDVASIVQELVDQNGWASGNAMAFMIDGTGHRRAYSYDKWRYGAPVLHVTYATTNNSDNLDGLAAGEYTLMVTDANGCEDTETITITEPTILSATATTEDVSCASSGSSTCDLMAASGAGHAVWLPGLPGCASASFYWKSGKGSFEVLPNGKAHVTGTIYNKYDSRREWEVDVWLTDKNDWTAWSGMGRSWKGNSSKVGNNYKDWDYYIMDASQSNRLIGKDKYNGKTLYLNHKPSNYQYAWQVGKAANDKNTNFGMSAWFTYTGSYSGHGDFNFDSDCGTATAGSCDGQALITATGGTAPYSYDWSTGDNTASSGTLCEGTHEVTVTDANGCEFIMDITIGAPQPILVSLTATSPTCFGNTDGQVSASVSGGTAPYTYQWNVTGTNSSIANLGAGMYILTVIDANGCSQTAEVQLDAPAAMQLATTTTQVSCYGSADGSASVSIQGGKAPYTIEWSTTTTGPDAFNLSAGGYEVSVTDANGCTAGATAIVTQPDAVSVSATSPTYSNGHNLSSNGAADGKINLTVTGGTRPYSYDWAGSVETTDYVWKQVNNRYHDAEESYRGYMSLTSSDLELVYDGRNKNQKVGMLFSHIDLPQGAIIEEAYIQFTSEGTKNSSSIDLDIYGHDVNNSWSFSSRKNNISSRTLTSTNVNWKPAKWNSKYKSGLDQQTPDLGNIVQEIVDRSGWSSGNCMTFIIKGSGSREAYSYDGSGARAPELIIKYRKAVQGKNPRDLAAGYYTVKVTDANGCMDSTNITLTEPNGGAAPIRVVKEVASSANHIEVSVSPNPVQGVATVTLNTNDLEEPTEMMVRVTDISGKTLETIYTGQALTGEQMQIQTSLNGLRSGIYQITVTTSDGKQTSKRFIVAR